MTRFCWYAQRRLQHQTANQLELRIEWEQIISENVRLTTQRSFFSVLQMLAHQRCDVLAEVLKRCLDDERLLLESYVNSDVMTLTITKSNKQTGILQHVS